MRVVLRAAKDFVDSGVPIEVRNESFAYLKQSIAEAVKAGCYGYKAVLGVEVKPMGQAEGRQHRVDLQLEADPANKASVESVQAYADAQNKKLGYQAFTAHAGKLWQATKQQLDEQLQEALLPENLLKFIKSINGILAKQILAIDQVKGTVETLRTGFIDRVTELQKGQDGYNQKLHEAETRWANYKKAVDRNCAEADSLRRNTLMQIESALQQDRNTRSMFDQNKIERLAKLEEQVAQLIKGPTKPQDNTLRAEIDKVSEAEGY